MLESGTFGSVRGVPGNGHPYRDPRSVPDPGHGVERYGQRVDRDVEAVMEACNPKHGS